MRITLTTEQASTAAGIQSAIDALGPRGGTVTLPEGEFTLDRGLELRPNVCLEGQGPRTTLRKGPGLIYRLAGYHNYGMMDVPLEHTEGLLPGMTVAIRDDVRGGFYETFARLTFVEGGRVGLDHGLESDYYDQANAMLVTAYPLVFGLAAHGAVVRNLTLDGAREQQQAGIGACRGAALYFYQTDGLTVEDVSEHGFVGEGLGFQMCAHVAIRRCTFSQNTGNGFHPGAGSTAVLFEDCAALENGASGFYFCVRANHITVRRCDLAHNTGPGMSIGKRDCHNLIEDCRMADNGGPGILFRGDPRPVEEHSIRIVRCELEDNCLREGRGQLEVGRASHDVVIADCRISGRGPGVYVNPEAERIYLLGNAFEGTWPGRVGPPQVWAAEEPQFACGREAVSPEDLLHLSGYLR